MNFKVRVIDDNDVIMFESSMLTREVFNKYFIDGCQINLAGDYEMPLNNYRHAINRIYEAQP